MEIKNLAQQYIYWPEINNTYQKNVDFSQTKVGDFKQLFEREVNSDRIPIEDIIIRFYALNEILAKLRRQENELLDQNALKLYEKYMDEVENSSKKLFAYVFFICLAEARHCYDLQNINSIDSILSEEDYQTKRKLQREVASQYQSILNKNENKYYGDLQTLNEKYGDIQYDYENSLYKEYQEKREIISNRYQKVHSRIHKHINQKAERQGKKLDETRAERAIEFRKNKINEYAEKFVVSEEAIKANNNLGEIITSDQIRQFFDLSKELTTLGSGRSSIYENLMPVLEKDEFKNINLEQMLKCVVNIFAFGHFSSGYGGLPWAGITAHNLNFVRGKINAEVFLDQAFSLEHNNGNMFNKDVIFKNAKSMSWRTYRINTEDNYHDSSYYSINNCQFLLNAQHQGQLLSIIGLDYTALDNKIGTSTFLSDYDTHKKSGLIPGNVDSYHMRNIDEYIEENLRSITKIASKFGNRNIDFINSLKQYKVDVPQLDIKTILNGCKSEGDGIVNLNEKHQLFHNLTKYQLNKYNNIHIQETRKNIQYDFSFEYLNTKNVPSLKLKKELLGNKAYGLAQMHSMDLPVPEALVFPTTNAAGYFSQKAKWINSLRPELNKIKDHFTDNEGNPIACSVRSGSSISMPGMMDTILNVGIDDSNYDYFCKKMGKEVTNECVTKFMSLFTKSLFNEEIKFSSTFSKALFQFREVLNRNNIPQNYEGKFPLNARQQYKWCLEAVFKSWHSERATAYRAHQNIDHDIGTAAIVQQMVFGNLNNQSCTGVVFSRDCISGEKGIIGEFLIKAQGEDVVSGSVTPQNIKELKDFNPLIYSQLLAICETLEKDTGDIQDIEFTVEDGKLYILQKRKAVCSSLAQTKLNQELFESGLITEAQMLSSINVDSLIAKEVVDTNRAKADLKGLVGNPGVVRGIVIHCEEDMIIHAEKFKENSRDTNFGWIFYAPETSPNHAPIMIKTQGFITSNGGFTSHAAILSRSWDKPCIVGVGEEKHALLEAGSIITMDANNGAIYKDILPLKEGSKKEIDALVTKILDFHKINLEDLNNENPLNNAIVEVNSRKSWMQEYVQTSELENKPVKHGQFLALGHKIALMLVKSQEDNEKLRLKAVAAYPKMLEQINLSEPVQNVIETPMRATFF